MQRNVSKTIKKYYRLPAVCKQMGRMIYVLMLALGIAGSCIAQSNISYAEYYVDNDPGLNLATPVSLTPGTTVANIPVTLNTNNLSTGVHVFGVRARTASGVWSLSHYCFLFKPYIAITAAPILSNIARVEYYIDQDPGFGKGTSVTITPGSNFADVNFNINPATLSEGPHLICARALTVDGLWSFTNYWMFNKPYRDIAAKATPNVNYVEYFIDQDPGIGKGTSVAVTAGVNLMDINMPVNITATATGPHILGARAKDASGIWSMTNYWMFVKPYSNITAAAKPNVTALEYYLDYDLGVGKCTPVAITAANDLVDLNINADITGIIPGTHNVVVRAKDANGNWSMVNNWEFTIPGTPPTLTTLVGTTALCAGSTINVGYQLSSPIALKATNQFIAQLSDVSGNFTSPVTIGTITSTNNTTNSFVCTIPANAAQSASYRIRVISTNQSLVGIANGSGITVYSIPEKPTYLTPKTDTTYCQGYQLSLQASSSTGYYQWYKNNIPIVGATAATYTVTNVATADAGSYKLVVSNYSSSTCNTTTAPIVIAINTNVPAVSSITPNGALGLCLGNSTTLTATAASSYQWYRDGVLIGGATNANYTVSAAGTYNVVTGNGTACFIPSSNNTVVSLGLAATKPTIILGGVSSFCQGSSLNLTSSALLNNQWYKNGLLVPGATGTSYNVTTGGYYKVTVSNFNCEVVSDSLLVVVNPTLVPSVSMVASTNNVPMGSNITFTATAVNGGTDPIFNFKVNNVSVQSSAVNTYSSSSFADGAVVSCVVTNNVACAAAPTATSANIVVSLLNPVTISGRVITPTGKLIPTATLLVTGDKADTSVTDAGSRFNFSLFQQRNYTITPNKNNDVVKANGVNVLDVLQTQAHIIGSTLLNSAYKVIAADVNSDGVVNLLDVILIKRLILGYDTTFPGKKLWAFADSLSTYPNPLNPFPFAKSKSYNNLSAAQSNQSFYGVKLGDVNQDWSAIPGFNRPAGNSKKLELYYDTVYVDNFDEARVRVRVRNFKDLMGMQFTIGFNQQLLQFAGIENKNLPVQSAEVNAEKGSISFIWADAANQPLTLKDGYVLFDFVLKKRSDFSEEDLSVGSTFTPAMAFGKNYVATDIIKVTGAIVDKKKQTAFDFVVKEKLDVSPNPSNGISRITIMAATAKKIVLVVSDVTGRVVYKKQVSLSIGINELPLNLRREASRAPGIYYISAKELDNVAAKVLMIKSE